MQIGPPWTPDRYEEIDHCIVRNSWKNTIINIQTEPTTNVNTDHLTMTVTVRQKLKAIEIRKAEVNLTNIGIGPETDPQGNTNPHITTYSDKVFEILTSNTTRDLGNVTEAIKQAAI